MTRILAALLFLGVAAMPFAIRKNSPAGTASPSGGAVLSIISPHSREVRQEYDRAFGAWLEEGGMEPMRLRWLDVGGTSKMLKDLESRFKTGGGASGADLMFGGGLDPYLRASESGWLSAAILPEDVVADIPPLCAGVPVCDPKSLWYGVALSGFGVIYNRSLLARIGLPEPESWEDLAMPRFFSWVGSGDPRSSGSVHMCYEIILQAYGFGNGWGIITRLCANVRAFGESGGAAPREVMAGDVAAGMAIDQYARRAVSSLDMALTAAGRVDECPSLGFRLPDKATVITPDCIAMLRGTARPEKAALFIRFALSEEGQRILFRPAGEKGQLRSLHRMPVMRRLYSEAGGPSPDPYATKASIRYDDAKGRRRWRVINDLIGKWCIDAHVDLAEAWRMVVAAGAPSALTARLCEAPLSEDELEKLASMWDDPRFRVETLARWASEARTRYRAVAREAALQCVAPDTLDI